MYSQNLVKVLEPVKKTTITRLNRGKKWKYGYNKEHDIIVISKSGTVGEIIEMQGLRIALPKVPTNVHVHDKRKWQKLEYPKELSKLKNIFDWRSYPEEAKDKLYDYIDENTYLLQPDQLFLYKQNNTWKVPKGYCWLQPIKNKNKFSIDKEQLVGVVKYTDGTINKNSLVGFHASGQYEFIVDGQRLYRVLSNLITIEYEYQGDEEAYNPSWAQSS